MPAPGFLDGDTTPPLYRCSIPRLYQFRSLRWPLLLNSEVRCCYVCLILASASCMAPQTAAPPAPLKHAYDFCLVHIFAGLFVPLQDVSFASEGRGAVLMLQRRTLQGPEQYKCRSSTGTNTNINTCNRTRGTGTSSGTGISTCNSTNTEMVRTQHMRKNVRASTSASASTNMRAPSGNRQ